jgi:ComEC/Rec2-related protein
MTTLSTPNKSKIFLRPARAWRLSPALKMLAGVSAGVALCLVVEFAAKFFAGFKAFPRFVFFGQSEPLALAIFALIVSTLILSMFVISALARAGVCRWESGWGRSEGSFGVLARSAAYWCLTILVGWLIAASGRSSPIEAPTRESIAPTRFPALLRGEITRVVRRDSLTLVLLVQGALDAKDLPPIAATTTLLRAHSRPVKDGAQLGVSAFALEMQEICAGMEIEAPVRMRFPRAASLPGEFDESFYVASLEASFIADARVEDLAILGKRWTLRRWSDAAAQAAERRIDELFCADTAPFALAFLTGNASRITPEERRNFARAGAAHILAASGLHVGLEVAVALVAVGFIRSRPARWFVASLGIALFVALAGFSPSAARAGAMASLFLALQYAERPPVLSDAAALSLLLLLAYSPALLYSISFQISGGAILGIAFTYPIYREAFLRAFRFFGGAFGARSTSKATGAFDVLGEAVAGAFGITLAASVTAAPIVAWHFGALSLTALPVNLVLPVLFVPAMTYVMAAVIVSTFWQGGGELLARAAELFLNATRGLSSFAAAPEFAAIEGGAAFSAALALSAATLYIASSRAPSVALFRTVSSAVIAALLAAYWTRTLAEEPFARCIPRERLCAVLPAPLATALPARDGENDDELAGEPGRLLLLCDRRLPSNPNASGDYALERYLAEYYSRKSRSANAPLTVCVAGVHSMIVAARLCSLLAQQPLQQRTPVRVMALSLLHKNAAFFAALDTLDKYGARALSFSDYAAWRGTLGLIQETSAEQFSIEQSSAERSSLASPRKLTWDTREALLIVSDNRRVVDSVLLPRAFRRITWK